MMDQTTAQQRGFDDFPLDRTENPYAEGTTYHALWMNGWNIAFMLMKRRIEGPRQGVA